MLTMTTQNIEDLSAQISAKTFTKILRVFAILIIAMCAGYYGLFSMISDIKSAQAVRSATTDGKFEVINSNLENVKINVKDLKDDVKDIKLEQSKHK